MKNINLSPPRIPIVNNVDVAIENEPEAIRAALARQACKPVRWVEVIRAIGASGVTDVIECGPGKVLAGLTRRIDPALQGHAVTDPESLARVVAATR